MASDIDYDIYDYNSSQDYLDIDYQIDLFEFRQSFKCKKQGKQKLKKSSCSLSLKNLKSQPTLMKMKCMNDKQTPKAERKSFRYDRYPTKSKFFECDEEFQTKPTDAQPNLPSKQLEDEHLQNFSKFRRHFYHINHQRIKSSLKDHSNIEIIDIRLASINESVQNDFMKRLNEEKSYFPELVYHGTKLQNIGSILHYGFLIPNRAHPTNSDAPILVPENSLSFSTGIYCSRTATYSLSYLKTTNTLLVCAALPTRIPIGKLQSRYKNNVTIFLSDVTKIIPLFLIDFRYLNESGINRPLFYQHKESKINETENVVVRKPAVISKKYLRKMLALMNDQERKNNQYQMRMFEPFN
jgi:hypothetical protein